MLFDKMIRERLTQRENELRQALGSIGQQLSELADCEADAGCRIPDVPHGELSEGVAGMLFCLRDGLVRDAVLSQDEGSDKCVVGVTRQALRLREDRNVLLTVLDDLVELAISTSRVSSWSDIEVRFLHFSLSLSEHLDQVTDALNRRPRGPGARVRIVCRNYYCPRIRPIPSNGGLRSRRRTFPGPMPRICLSGAARGTAASQMRAGLART